MSLHFADDSRRCETLAVYLIENNTTVRSTAGKFGISKSTVHKDVTQRLAEINRPLYEQVREVLDANKAQRHLRGGEATKIKYLFQRAQKEKQNREK